MFIYIWIIQTLGITLLLFGGVLKVLSLFMPETLWAPAIALFLAVILLGALGAFASKYPKPTQILVAVIYFGGTIYMFNYWDFLDGTPVSEQLLYATIAAIVGFLVNRDGLDRFAQTQLEAEFEKQQRAARQEALRAMHNKPGRE